MARPAPHGPLLGNELAWAIKLLTVRQLRAYQYRREGHAWDWIAQRMGISRTAVIHHVAKAEKRLGYEPTVTAKQRTPYKSVARKKAESENAWDLQARLALAQMTPAERQRFASIVDAAASEDEAERRLRKRLSQLTRERRARERRYDDESRAAARRGEDQLAAEVQVELGLNLGELVVDDGKGHDRL